MMDFAKMQEKKIGIAITLNTDKPDIREDIMKEILQSTL